MGGKHAGIACFLMGVLFPITASILNGNRTKTLFLSLRALSHMVRCQLFLSGFQLPFSEYAQVDSWRLFSMDVI